MAVTAITNDIDHGILGELHAIVAGQAGDVHRGLWIFSMHVKDGHHEHLGHIRGVPRGTSVIRERRESDLVVDDQVDGASRAVAFQLR